MSNIPSVIVVNKTENPNLLAYKALVLNTTTNTFDPNFLLADIAVQKKLNSASFSDKRKAFAHPGITFYCINYPAFVAMEAQKQFSTVLAPRACSIKIHKFVEKWKNKAYSEHPKMGEDIEDLFWFLPIGTYVNKEGKEQKYTAENKKFDIACTIDQCRAIAYRINCQNDIYKEIPPLIPYHFKQNFLLTFTATTLVDFIAKKYLDPKLNLEMAKKKQTLLLSFPMENLIINLEDHFTHWLPKTGERLLKDACHKLLL